MTQPDPSVFLCFVAMVRTIMPHREQPRHRRSRVERAEYVTERSRQMSLSPKPDDELLRTPVGGRRP